MPNIFNLLGDFFGDGNSTKKNSNKKQPIDNYPDEFYTDAWGRTKPLRNSSLDDYIDPNEFMNRGLTDEEIEMLVTKLTDDKAIE